jgi:hypothetical protein
VWNVVTVQTESRRNSLRLEVGRIDFLAHRRLGRWRPRLRAFPSAARPRGDDADERALRLRSRSRP